MAAGVSYTPKFYGQVGLYRIVSNDGSDLPPELVGHFTHPGHAQTAIAKYFEKLEKAYEAVNKARKSNGKGRSQEAVQDAGEGVDN